MDFNIGSDVYLPSRTLYHLLSLVVLLFLVTFAQGQGPGSAGESVHFYVEEGLPPGTVVGNIPTRSSFTYHFHQNSSYFVLDRLSGLITTADVLDREVLLNDINILVISSMPVYPIEVTITVLDINDNIPHFPQSQLTITFTESEKLGMFKYIGAATDEDQGANGTTTNYQIISRTDIPVNKFQLEYDPDIYGRVVKIKNIAILNREEKDFYQLNISVQDQGELPLFGYLTLNINIDDANDNPPVFDVSEYVASLNETTARGSVVIHVEANDLDVGVNGDITYTISDDTDQFTIDENTGVISTSVQPPLHCLRVCGRSVDLYRCQPRSCFLTVEAQDHGTPPHRGRAYVTVNIIDENNHDPRITFQYQPLDNFKYSSINEDAKNGSVVALVTVQDQDDGVNGETSIDILSGNERGHFRLTTPFTFNVIIVNGVNELDRERIAMYNLTIRAMDGGSPPRSSTAFLVIIINDVNDHSPWFERTEYRAELSEFAPIGSYVANVHAVDMDTGINAELTYRIRTGNADDWFHIDSGTGLVTVKNVLDYEQLTSATIIMNISVEDSGQQPFTNYTVLMVTIWDENDVTPTFQKNEISVSLMEGTPSGTPILTLTAEDADSGQNGTIDYKLSSDVSRFHPNKFHLDRNTGRMILIGQLDRETVASYTIHVIANDLGTMPLSSTATVYLNVLDLNDNVPVFYPVHYPVNFLKNQPQSTEVVRVVATDPDNGINGTVRYSFVGDVQDFHINPDSGMITTTKMLNSKTLYNLFVAAKDGQQLEAHENAVVTVSVVNASTVAPVFHNQPYNFSVVEDDDNKVVQTGTEVGRLLATSDIGQITYSIVDGDPYGHFGIGLNTGVVTKEGKVNREVKSTYALKVMADDGELFTEAKVTIAVRDMNDNSPQFEQVSVDCDIIENWPVGHGVYQAKASDLDAGMNSQIVYSLHSDAGNTFVIHEKTGMIHLSMPLNKQIRSYFMTVTATDSGTPHHQSVMNVNAHIKDINDHTPIFDLRSYEISVIESLPVNHEVYKLSASDADFGANGYLLYNVTRGNEEGSFGIFPNGILYVAHPLDRERNDIYRLTITATDRADNPRSSAVNVTIHILDSNDNRPLFGNTTYLMSIHENMPAGSLVGYVGASDLDIGRNAQLSYQIQVADDFTIDSQTGEIKTQKVFDREYLVQSKQQNFYEFHVIVHDNGLTRLEDTATVKVRVLDDNDNAPKFQNSIYKESIPEDMSVFSPVLKVQADDLDAGENSMVTYLIVSGNDATSFEMNPGTGQITLIAILDRETDDFYLLVVTATDSGQNIKLTATTTVEVEIRDVNDNFPLFDQSAIEVRVVERTPPGHDIGTFWATDTDLGNNAAVSFAISGQDDDGMFSIDASTGKLYLIGELDYEVKNIYRLNVTASDNGRPRLSSFVPFTVYIDDVNDNAPVFTDLPVVRITEGISLYNDTIIKVHADDADSGDFGTVTYAIILQEPAGSHFGIDRNTGNIFATAQIDREISSIYKLSIVASDGAPELSRKSSTSVITMFVEDINDNFPRFLSMDTFVIQYPTTQGSTIARIEATDPDSGDNGRVTYSIYGSRADLFDMDNELLRLVQNLSQLPVMYSLTVRAIDHGTSPKYSDLICTLILKSSEQNGPSFTQSLYVGQITENAEPGSSILRVATTYSSSNGDVEFYITSIRLGTLPVEKYFQIDKSSGVLSNAVYLDREKIGDDFTIEIYAVDTQGDQPRANSVQARVTLEDENDSAPMFSQTLYSPEVEEDVLVGSTVARVHVEDPDVIGQPYLTIIDGSDSIFTLEQDGSIKVNRKLDRETVAKYILKIRAEDGIHTAEAMVSLTVLDVNDNAPAFTQTDYSIDIFEDTPTSTTVGRVFAVDNDLGTSGQVTYSFNSDWGQDIFQLDPTYGTITLLSPVDFETNQLYTLKVKATDGGSPALTSLPVLVYMNIKDVNDNTPVFDPMSYSQTVFENIVVGTSVLQVAATDIDSGKNREVIYSIIDGDPKKHFTVDPVSGNISTTTSLDRESDASYTLVVKATDQAESLNDRLTSIVQVSITVKDINDCYPEFTTPSMVWVRENSPANSVLYTIRAEDKDEGENSYVHYKILRPSLTPFTIDPIAGHLRASIDLDREIRENYSIVVTATDSGDSSLASTQTFTIFVEDENDNSPRFSESEYRYTVEEDVSVGDRLLHVSALDDDAGLNGMVRYFIISGDDNQDFNIDQSSGVLSVQKSLDFERKSLYNLAVQAEDSGIDVQYATANVVISVSDVNDNKPVFVDSPYHAYVQENRMELPVYVTKISARDDDSGVNSEMTYSIREGDKSIFNIDEVTGEITAKQTLNRESKSVYTLVIIAIDSGSTKNTGTGTVTIFVEDVNDNDPVFQHGGSYVAHISENLPEETEVISVQAMDADAGINAEVIYSLETSMGGMFTILPKSGSIVTMAILDREQQDVYILTVIATDQGIPARHGTATVTVHVDDQNDNVPEFEHREYSAILTNPTTTGEFVLGVLATDRDVGENGMVTYSITGLHSSRFLISTSSGVVTASQQLSTTGAIYQIEIHAIDQGSSPSSSSITARIQMSSSLPANRPQFNPVQPDLHVSENRLENHVVTTVTANSRAGGTIVYSIAGGNIGRAFTISPKTGTLKVFGSIDYEMTHVFRLWVAAEDASASDLTSYIEVVIAIDDNNDNAPRFSQLHYGTEISERSLIHSSVVVVHATDLDSGNNGAVHYRFGGQSADQSTFRIDDETGLIRTGATLDREEIDHYELVIEAYDLGSPAQTSIRTVTVVILDENDTPPKFTRTFSVSVMENTEVGTIILTVTSVDDDIGQNAAVTYNLSNNGDGKFSINNQTGNVSVSAPLDTESRDRYSLEVTASDGAHHIQTWISVHIADINDHIPQFVSPLVFVLGENKPAQSFVGQISAIDGDFDAPNNQIRYSLKLPSDLFELDSMSGQIASLKPIEFLSSFSNRELANRYEFIVMATDLGTPRRSIEAKVIVNVIDANNNAPMFEKTSYHSAVPEDAGTGSDIITVIARDDLDHGINRDVFYTVTGGNGSSLFDVDTDTGVIRVVGSLRRRQNNRYIVTVKAQDKGQPPQFVSVNVYLTVTDVNRYMPVFAAGTDMEVDILEDTNIGETIQTFRATDSDSGLNGLISYFITAGNSLDLFRLDEVRGDLFVNKPLDFDTIPEHKINITARDNGLLYKETTIIFTVKLIDVNDNDPVFDQPLYEAYVAENSHTGTLVFRAFATDADSGPNKNIEYVISSQQFIVERTTGIIRTREILDYETKDSYTITVLAINPSTSRKGSTQLLVHVTSENDYLPHFINRVYNFTVSESAAVGTSVGTVIATDQDKGEDGIVYYFLIGSSNAKGFKIEAISGVVKVSGQPDYESSPQVVLEVLAKNFGSVKGNETDHCIVGITVQDANDPPVFSQEQYSKSIPENSPSGTEVIQVFATDYDINQIDKQFTFIILGGNSDGIFGIGRRTGLISVIRDDQLDRETLAEYELVIGAEDRGIPPRTGSTSVHIELLDVNDNGPHFTSTNLVTSVLENQPIGTTVIDLTSHTDDMDLPPNQGEFHYFSVSGSHDNVFEVRETGVVRTKSSLNREAIPRFSVLVLVKDDGSPTMSSTLTFTVNIDDINDNPPTPRDLKIYLAIYDQIIVSEPFANVRPLDEDISGHYSCVIENGSDRFWIDSDCKLGMSSLTSSDLYSLQVSGNDNKFSPVTYDISVELVHFDNTTVEHSIVMRIDSITGENFMANQYHSLKTTLRDQLVGAEEVVIYSIKELQSDLLIFLAVRNQRNGYFMHDVLKRQLENIKSTIESAVAGIVIKDFAYSGCNDISCLNNGECLNRIMVRDNVQYVDSPHLVFSSRAISFTPYCNCPAQYDGDQCQEAVNPCGTTFCQNGGTCIRDENREICDCIDGWGGQNCATIINACLSNPCRNSGLCEDLPGSFTCHCLQGFTGKYCDIGFNHCSSGPCRNGATCENLVDSFLCHCPYTFWGTVCESASRGFEEGSYMEFSSIAEFNNIIDVTLATTKANALLLYNPSEVGSNEFIALEIIHGSIRFSVNLGGRETLRLTIPVNIDTGEWFRVQANRDGTVASLRVSHCPDVNTCEECVIGDTSCYAEGVQSSMKLEVKGHKLSIGGIKDITTLVIDHPGQIVTHDFIGCIHYFLINGVDMLQFHNGSNRCPRASSTSLCLNTPCHNSGKCFDEWSDVSCNCQSSHIGPACQTEWEPFAFGPGSMVKYTLQENYRRDELLKETLTRSSRSIDGSSILIRFRSTKDSNLLFSAKTISALSLIWIDQGILKYSVLKADNPTTIAVDKRPVTDGKWHNVTVTVTGQTVTVAVDYNDTVSSNIMMSSFPFSSLDVLEMTLGGVSTPIHVSGYELKDFSGCISRFELDGEPVTMNGSNQHFNIESVGDVQIGCHQLCSGNPCGAKSSCQPVGEEINCVALPAVDSEPLTVGVIVVIVFFGVLLIVLVIVFVIFRVRRQLCFKRKSGDQNKENGTMSGMKSVNSSNHSHQDSGYGDTGEPTDEIFIQNHVAQEMLGLKYQEQNSNLVRPDIIGSDPKGRSPMPLEIDDGTVIIENGDIILSSISNDVPECYDIDTASSIAPSDIDVHEHYRHFRDGKGPKCKTNPHMAHYRRQHYSPQNPGIRESPVSTSSHGRNSSISMESPGASKKFNSSHLSRQSPYSDRHTNSSRNIVHTSPNNLGVKKSPMNQLSRQSPNVRQSAFVPMNVQGSEFTHPSGSGTNSDHSPASYHSRNSASAVQDSHRIPSGHVRYGHSNGAHSRHKIIDPHKNYRGGLTVEQVDRLNSRSQHIGQESLLDVVSSSSNEHRKLKNGSSHLDTSILLEAPDSTSDDSANDSFTCSEFEHDNHLYDKAWGDLDPGAMLFSKLAKVDNHTNYNQQHNPIAFHDGLNSKGNSFNSNSEEEPLQPPKLPNGQFNWDYLLNWGPSFERLVGVFKDIALLPDGENVENVDGAASTNQEEYV